MSAHPLRAAVLVAGLILLPGSARTEEAASGTDPARASAAAERLGLAVDASAPMTIEADELEASQADDGRDRVVFEKRVKVAQGGMVLHCDWLEAIYPPRVEGESGGQPQRITARGQVRIEQGGNVARCSEAVFNNQACSAECTASEGRATLSRGEDLISADRIFFDLCDGVLKARGKVLIETRPVDTSE